MEKGKHNFNDFTIKNYKKLLKIAKNKFNFISYQDVFYFLNSTKKFVLWRHDVDFSLHRAKKLAILEAEFGVKATYFILLHSIGYNVMEKECYNIIKDIVKLNHDIGLHFDFTFYEPFDQDKLLKFIVYEKNILEFLVEKEVNCISLHNPILIKDNGEQMTLQEVSEVYPYLFQDKICGMINTYGKVFRENISYNSDSNGYWRFRSLEEVLLDDSIEKLQVLTHPEWWVDNPLPPRKRIWRALYGRAKSNMKTYDEFLKKNKRENINE